MSIKVYKCLTSSKTQIKKGVPYALIKEYIKYAYKGIYWSCMVTDFMTINKGCLRVQTQIVIVQELFYRIFVDIE